MFSGLPSILTILVGMYGLRLSFAGQLTYYIHPRYVVATTIACAVLVAIGIAVFAFAPVVAPVTRRRSARTVVGLMPVIALVMVGFFVPARPLSSAAADARRTTVATVTDGATDGTRDTLDVSTVDTSEWSFDDWWYALMVQDRTLAHYDGKQVDMVGFASFPKSSPPESYYLSRFLVMCCAIDAQPVGFWVDSSNPDVPAPGEEGVWLRVRGTFDLLEWDGKKTLRIIPETVETTEQPEDPYVY